ncbi:DUF1080 domain-containing protein [Arundinibacter roseus]|uniref:DUF1080 domain-containing protein n=2 Tax=Arundinibacter roseus TaxID=2070510 RepID=A0A4R4K980_9BACT|nr:DUF1080 domain-containing protein [Arundinibacter roseus]
MASQALYAQKLPLNDLSAFTVKSDNWRIVGDATVDISKANTLTTAPGKGVLACIHKQGTYGNQYELISNFTHGDLDIEMDFMLAKGSNSGIYLQGNYEIQLFDSWGKKSAKYNDCGGIYERWDDSKPEGQKGYEGYAPRLNVAKAPGLWQHIKISYQAPRFDAAGKKISNAVFLNVELNGITIHENVEVSGPTRGALSADVPMGPLRIQGDHGSLAIRNMVVNNFDKKPGTLTNLTYKTYYGNYSQDLDPATLTVAETGKSEALTWDVLKENNNYVLVYTGTYNAPTAGDYTFKIQASGNSYLKIDGKEILPNEWKTANDFRIGKTSLTAGDHSVSIYLNKRDGWLKPVLGMWVAGPGFREVAYHSLGSTLGGSPADPILVHAATNTVLRSFMDVRPADGKRQRIVHNVNVGSPANLHYSYDLDKGSVFQVWRGEFLDASPMWNDRGDGSSRPRGSVTLLNDALLLGKATGQSAWNTDTTGSGFRPKGYSLDENDLPTFHYEAFGTSVSDQVKIVDGAHFDRTVKLSKPVKGLMARLGEGKSIEKVSDGLYAFDDKSYYIQVPATAAAPVIREVNGKKELLVPFEKEQLNYAILF